MKAQRSLLAVGAVGVAAAGSGLSLWCDLGGAGEWPSAVGGKPDAAAEVRNVKDVPEKRPQQKLTKYDRSGVFNPGNAPPVSRALDAQPEQGRVEGYDFSRDPLDAKAPKQSSAELLKLDKELKPEVIAFQKKLLETRYDLTPKLDPEAKMSRGKPLAVGPTARLGDGMTWEQLAGMTAAEIKDKSPYPPLPHPKHTPGGMAFPQMQIAMFPRLARVDVDFDLPEAFLPAFPPAMCLQNRPEWGDVSGDARLPARP